MGKRKKSSRKPGPSKKKEPLDTVFSCIFCHHEKSVACKIDKKESLGHLYCKICGQTFQTRANYLTEPVDIFADWIDASEAASKAYNNRKAGSPITPTAEPGSSRAAAAHTSAPVDIDIDEREERAPPRRRFVQEESDED